MRPRRSATSARKPFMPAYARPGCRRSKSRLAPDVPVKRNRHRPKSSFHEVLCQGLTTRTSVAATSRVLRVIKVSPRVIAVAAINVSITDRLRPADSSPQSQAAAASTGRSRSAKVASMLSTHSLRPAPLTASVRAPGLDALAQLPQRQDAQE